MLHIEKKNYSSSSTICKKLQVDISKIKSKTYHQKKTPCIYFFTHLPTSPYTFFLQLKCSNMEPIFYIIDRGCNTSIVVCDGVMGYSACPFFEWKYVWKMTWIRYFKAWFEPLTKKRRKKRKRSTPYTRC